jgi:hypothetical protein
MLAGDRLSLDSVLAAYIDTSIARASLTGEMVFRYRLAEAELCRAIGRSRLHERMLADVRTHFRNANVSISHDPKSGLWDIAVDLNRCVLNHTQAVRLSFAIKQVSVTSSVNRSENGSNMTES